MVSLFYQLDDNLEKFSEDWIDAICTTCINKKTIQAQRMENKERESYVKENYFSSTAPSSTEPIHKHAGSPTSVIVKIQDYFNFNSSKSIVPKPADSVHDNLHVSVSDPTTISDDCRPGYQRPTNIKLRYDADSGESNDTEIEVYLSDNLLAVPETKCGESILFFQKECTKKYCTLFDLLKNLEDPAEEQKLQNPSFQTQLMSIATLNLSKGLPPKSNILEVYLKDETLPKPKTALSQLELTCKLLTKVITSPYVKKENAIIDKRLCRTLITLFDSEKRRERQYLKLVVYNIYKRFKNLRQTIRDAISNEFYTFVYETEQHNGVTELLSICEAIICGFVAPLKEKHNVFLEKVLIPLHKPRNISQYHNELASCISLYVVKDCKNAITVLKALMKLWPWRDSEKQLIFLQEFETFLGFLTDCQIVSIQTELCNFFMRLIDDNNHEAILGVFCLWDNSILISGGFLGKKYASILLPYIYDPILQLTKYNWHPELKEAANTVLDFYEDVAQDTFEICEEQFENEYNQKIKLHQFSLQWETLENRRLVEK